jgi:hypothetical protein
MLELITLLWMFNTAQPAQSLLTAQAPQAEFAAAADPTAGFTVKFTLDLKNFVGEKNLLDIPNVLSVRLRQHDPLERNFQNYPAFKMPDGSVPVLEATVVLHSAEHPDWKNLTIGIPLALLKKPQGQHEIVLNFSGARWTMYVDGELLDNEFPFGYPQWEKTTPWQLDAGLVTKAAIYLPAITPGKLVAKKPNTAPVQYWTPPGHNSWVGDVATLFYKGRYHVFYLYDRRHHHSKFATGGHYFEHLSTTDFKTWTEHEAATPIDEQWETIGTGTPFVFNDKLCVSYGLHTTRIYPQDKTTLPAQWAALNQNGRTGAFNRATTPGIPAGATYAVSADGVSNFKKSQVMFHPCENPSVYTDPSGKLRMMANFHSNGIWESDSIDGGWRCINPGFPPGGDCTFFFRWGKFDYIIGGFTGLWSKPATAPNSAYADVAGKGLDFYDGTAVPAVSEISGGRFLMAGWLPMQGGWGGNLIIRELMQFPDGRIGSKWFNEIMPETAPPTSLAANIAATSQFPTDGKSFMLTFTVQPAAARQGKFGIAFLPETGEQASCELQLVLDELRAQFGPASLTTFAGKAKSLREGEGPHHLGNYAIENLIGVDKPFAVRLIVKIDAKIGGTLIDAEIAGQRTMVAYRPDLSVRKLLFRTEGVELRNVQFAPLKNQDPPR